MPRPDVSLAELVADLPATLVGCDANLRVHGLETDSRRVEPGHVFVAVAGATVDGHAYVDAARARGAAVAVVSRQRWSAAVTSAPTIIVDDTARYLGRLAARAYEDAAAQLDLVGITGTNGKTTAAFLVAQALAATGRLHMRLGTTGHWIVDHERAATYTTPFPAELHRAFFAARKRGATCGVMEVSSHALSQGRVDGLRFVGVGLTSFSQDHLDYHADLDDYLAAKCRLPGQHVVPGGLVVAPVEAGDASAAFVAAGRSAGARACLVSATGADEAAWRVASMRERADGMQLVVDGPLGRQTLDTPLIGAFNRDNVLVAAALLSSLGLARDEIGAGLAAANGAPGRLQRVRVDTGTAFGSSPAGPTVFVDYAHTPDAVARVITVVRPLTRGRIIVVLGCGGDRDRSKRPLMGRLAATTADHLIATSDNPRTEDPERILDDMLVGLSGPKLERVVDRAVAVERAIAMADVDDTVLVLGKGHERVQIVGVEKRPFDDVEHVRRALLARA